MTLPARQAIAEARALLASSRESEPCSPGQVRALADAVERLAAVIEGLLDHIAHRGQLPISVNVEERT